MSTYRSTPAAVSIETAAANAPTLARLMALALQSQQRLADVAPLLPANLLPGIQAGAIEADQWCLLAANNAVAAKLRQLTPTLLAHLRTQGCAINGIRIKVQIRDAQP